MEVKEKLEAAEVEISMYKSSLDKMESRCDELTNKYEAERKLRLESERDSKKSKSKSSSVEKSQKNDEGKNDFFSPKIPVKIPGFSPFFPPRFFVLILLFLKLQMRRYIFF